MARAAVAKGRQLSLSSFGDFSQITSRRSSIGELGSFIIFKMAMRGVIYIFLCSNVAFKILQRVKWAWRKGRSFAMRSRFWLICLVKFPKLTEYVDKSLKIVPKLLLCIVCWTQDIIWDSLHSRCFPTHTLFRNQIQTKRSVTDQFSSNYYILHIYMSC